ncbi:MAG: SpoIIE family protein phosphatase [Chitinivibrionia bacterium]|nr:SpoIIE family protein phosphatase [Chitinivibrionia bacterium]
MEVVTKKAETKEKTIAVFIESLDGYYQSGVWGGIKKVSQEKDINVIAFVGGSLGDSPNDPYEQNRNLLYEIPKLMKFDGIVISGSLCSYISKENIDEFIARYSDIPMASILPLSSKIPAATIDNRYGMEQLTIHLIDEHKFKKFAFICGPTNNPEAKERLSAFKDALKSRNIEISKDSIFSGSFDRKSGADAVRKIAGENDGKIPYEAIVCIDDETAFGAIETLKELGLDVPQDIAVTGFDNTSEGKYIFPPLTSVDQPLRKLGEESLIMLLKKIENNDVSDGVILRTELVKRHSCGCFFDYDIPKGRIRQSLLDPVATKDFLSKEDLHGRTSEFFDNVREVTNKDKILLKQLAYLFCKDVNSRENERFLKFIRKEFQNSVMKGSKLSKLSQICRVFWYYSIGHLNREAFAYADMLLTRASELKFDMLNQYDGFKRLKMHNDYALLHEIKRKLANAGNYDKILSVIAKSLPQIGFDTFFMLRYKSSPSNKFMTPKLVLAVKNGKKLIADSNSESEVLPQTVFDSATKPFVIVTEPLHFRNETFGVLYFVLDKEIEYEDNIFEILGAEISDAIHTEQLMSRQEKEREKEHSQFQSVKHELELGSDIQRSFLPQQIYQPNGFNIEVVYEPAREVSGDFYDVYKLSDDKVVVLIADVSGKDVSSALFMALTNTLLQVLTDKYFKNSDSPFDSVYATNDYIVKYNHHHKGRFMFTTLLFGILYPETGVFEYINAGHNPGFLYSADGKLREELKSAGPAIGITDAAKFPIKSCVIQKGEFLFLYTDGVTDTQNNKKKFYSSKRLVDKLSAKKYNNSHEVITAINDDVSNFRKINDRFDDITMVALFRTE